MWKTCPGSNSSNPLGNFLLTSSSRIAHPVLLDGSLAGQIRSGHFEDYRDPEGPTTSMPHQAFSFWAIRLLFSLSNISLQLSSPAQEITGMGLAEV